MKKHKPMKEVEGRRSAWWWLDTSGGVVGVVAIAISVAVFFVNKFNSIDRQFDRIDNRFEQIDNRFEQVDKRFDQLESRFDKQENLVHSDLMWRYFYSKDPGMKNRRPVYDPIKRTLEFVVVDSVSKK